MARRRRTPDRCPACGADALFGGFFNSEGLAETDDRTGARWNHVCQNCGEFVDPLPPEPNPR